MSGARKLSPKQRQVMLWWQKNYDAIICDGAVRSGKTFCMGVALSLIHISKRAHDPFGKLEFGL